MPKDSSLWPFFTIFLKLDLRGLCVAPVIRARGEQHCYSTRAESPGVDGPACVTGRAKKAAPISLWLLKCHGCWWQRGQGESPRMALLSFIASWCHGGQVGAGLASSRILKPRRIPEMPCLFLPPLITSDPWTLPPFQRMLCPGLFSFSSSKPAPKKGSKSIYTR